LTPESCASANSATFARGEFIAITRQLKPFVEVALSGSVRHHGQAGQQVSGTAVAVQAWPGGHEASEVHGVSRNVAQQISRPSTSWPHRPLPQCPQLFPSTGHVGNVVVVVLVVLVVVSPGAHSRFGVLGCTLRDPN